MVSFRSLEMPYDRMDKMFGVYKNEKCFKTQKQHWFLILDSRVFKLIDLTQVGSISNFMQSQIATDWHFKSSFNSNPRLLQKYILHILPHNRNTQID